MQVPGQLIRTFVLLSSSAEYLDPRKSLPRHMFLEVPPPHAHTAQVRNTPLSPLCEASCTRLPLGLPPPALQLLSPLPTPHVGLLPSSPLPGHYPMLPASAQFSSDSSICLVGHGIPSLLARCQAHSRHFMILNKYNNLTLCDTTLDVD